VIVTDCSIQRRLGNGVFASENSFVAYEARFKEMEKKQHAVTAKQGQSLPLPSRPRDHVPPALEEGSGHAETDAAG
jgi:hypothetical protein